MKRIQRKRTKGWCMPENAVYIGRPTKWGNIYYPKNDKDGVYRAEALLLYRQYVECMLVGDPHFLDPLLGKDLACWCPLDKKCHADILLEMLK